MAFVLGIALDRAVPSPSTRDWLLLAAASILLSSILPASARPARTCLILGLILALGAARHHSVWFEVPGDHLVNRDWRIQREATVRGTIVEGPDVRSRTRSASKTSAAGDESAWTSFVLETHALRDGDQWTSSRGRVLVTRNGSWSEYRPGDTVEVSGKLEQRLDPRNPGQPDPTEWDRAQGFQLRMSATRWFADHSSPVDGASRLLGILRTESERRLTEHLDPDTAALAQALLLGRRVEIAGDVNQAFLKTGTVHVLAISGLHLQILAIGPWFIGPAIGLKRNRIIIITMLSTVCYAVLVGASPSVLRAAVTTVVVGVFLLLDRRIGRANCYAAAVLVTLAVDPADLFHAGWQLSFLGVAGLIWLVPGIERLWRERRSPDALDLLERRLRSPWRRAFDSLLTITASAILASLAVWTLTLPIVASRFHLVPWVGIPLNIPLVALSGIALWAAFLVLVLGSLWSPLAAPAAWVCDFSLRGMQGLILLGAKGHIGHQFVAGVPDWLVLSFYLAAGLLLLALAAGRFRAWAMPVAGSLLAASLLLAYFPPRDRPDHLRIDFLAVEHGLATIIEDKHGLVWLYDCGQMMNPAVGQRTIAPALWQRGLRRIDCIVLSHADSDHVNGLIELLDRFPVRVVRVPKGLTLTGNDDLAQAFERLHRDRIPIEEIQAGSSWSLAGGATIRTLAPSPGLPANATDNERSVVLEVATQGARVILTGDVEGDGLVRLTDSLQGPVDVWLAPHHGGRDANPKWVYDWIRPRAVIASQRRGGSGTDDALAEAVPRGTPIWRTWERGAIRVEWLDSGRLTLRPARETTVSDSSARAP
jgi:competence protein ComEC